MSLLVYRAFPRASDQERNRQSVSAFMPGLLDRYLKRELMEGDYREMQEVKRYILYEPEAYKSVSSWRSNSFGR